MVTAAEWSRWPQSSRWLSGHGGSMVTVAEWSRWLSGHGGPSCHGGPSGHSGPSGQGG